jgi:3-oxoacyl-(acyl-carrier-protein) synthase
VANAELAVPFEQPKRAAVVVASATGGMWTMHEQAQALQRGGYRRLSAHFLPNMLVDSAPAHLAIEFGAHGPNMAVVNACSTGSGTIAEAAELLRRGQADVVLAGGTEACIVPLFMAGFAQMRGLAGADQDGPAAAAKPFDARRRGLVVGEGAAVLVLESADHVRQRGARPLAQLVGYGLACDAHHMAQPHPEARGMAEAFRLALESSKLAPGDIDYVSAHGTATMLNDRLETLALKQVLGDTAYRIPVSSIKGAIGHTMGAAGAIEAAVCVQAIQSGMIPPTINYADPDPDCDLDYVPNTARTVPVSVALSNSFGMGGHNATLAFGAV